MTVTLVMHQRKFTQLCYKTVFYESESASNPGVLPHPSIPIYIKQSIITVNSTYFIRDTETALVVTRHTISLILLITLNRPNCNIGAGLQAY